MKKVLSFVLASSLLLGSVSFAFAAPANGSLTDLAGKKCELQATALVDLGVIKGYPDGTFGPEKSVTRAEMAALILQGLGLKETGSSNTFKDSQSHWGKNWIGLAQNLGIITGYGDGTFKPDNNVNYNEAMSMLVKALGYNENSLTGSWPGNYATKAQRLGIMDSVTAASGNANRGDISIMLFNTLEQEMGATDKDGKWTSDKTTMLDALGAKVDEDFRVIKDTDDGYINLYPFIGKSVKAYTIKKGSDKNKILAIKEVGSTTLVGKITAAGEFETTKDEITYHFADGKSTYVPFVNGESAASTDAAISKKKNELTLEVKLSGKSIEKIYSVSEWNGDTFMYSPDMLDGDEFDHYKLPTEVDGKTVDTKKFELLGAESLKKIEKDSVVTVYKDSKGFVKRIAVNTKTIDGKVTKISAKGEYTIGDKVYKLAEGAARPQLGETGTAHLDYAGKIFEWKVNQASQGNFAVLLAAQEAKGSIDNDQIKVYTKAGKEVVLSVKTDAEFAKVSKAAIGSMIEYIVNKDGVVTEINVRTLKNFDGKFSASGNLIGSKPVNSNAIVFIKDGKDDYSLAKVADLQKDDALTTGAGLGYYIPSGESKIVAMIVVKSDTNKSNSVYAVLNKVDTAINSDNEKVDYLTGLAGGKEYNAYADKLNYFPGFVKNGGLVELKVNSDGVVTATTASINAKAKLIGKTVEKVDGKLLKMKGEDTWVSADSKAVVYAYNDDKEVYETKSLSSLKGKYVDLYQVDKDSEQYDIIVVRTAPNTPDPTTPPAVITTPPAVITTPPAVVPTPPAVVPTTPAVTTTPAVQ